MKFIAQENGMYVVQGSEKELSAFQSDLYEITKQIPLTIRPLFPECIHRTFEYKKLKCGRMVGRHVCTKYNKTATVPDCRTCLAENKNESSPLIQLD